MRVGLIIQVLEKLEWSGIQRGQGYGYMGSGNDGASYPACPECRQLKSPNAEMSSAYVGHKADCRMKLALDEARGG